MRMRPIREAKGAKTDDERTRRCSGNAACVEDGATYSVGHIHERLAEVQRWLAGIAVLEGASIVDHFALQMVKRWLSYLHGYRECAE
jgi:hypothetical protein